MRRSTLCWLVLGIAACGGGGGGGSSSGVPRSQVLDDLTQSDIDQICAWAVKPTVSYQPSEREVCTVYAYGDSDDRAECEDTVSECVAEPNDVTLTCDLDRERLDGCEVTVGEYEQCVRAVGAVNRKYFQTASCEDGLSEVSLPPACERILEKCPWLGDGDRPGDGNDPGGFDDNDGGFVCDDGTDIDDFFLCDGEEDCWNGEDEDGCGVLEPDSQFDCDDGGSTSTDFVCDGLSDCLDGSDEWSCDGGFICDDGVDIIDSARCDSFIDCSNGEDEEGCADQSDTYVCADGTTYPADYECDQVPDCSGGEDEVGCP